MPPEGLTNALDAARYLELVAQVEREREQQRAHVITRLPDWRASIQGTLSAEQDKTVETDRLIQSTMVRIIRSWRQQLDTLLDSIEKRYKESITTFQAGRLGGIMDEVHRSENKNVNLTVDEITEVLIPACERNPRMKMSFEYLTQPPPYAFIETEGESPPGTKSLRWAEVSQMNIPVTLQWMRYDNVLKMSLHQINEGAKTLPISRANAALSPESIPVHELYISTRLLPDEEKTLLSLIPLIQRKGLERLRYDEEALAHDVDVRLPGVHVGTGNQKVWKLLTEVRGYFLKPELAKQLPAHAAVA